MSVRIIKNDNHLLTELSEAGNALVVVAFKASW